MTLLSMHHAQERLYRIRFTLTNMCKHPLHISRNWKQWKRSTSNQSQSQTTYYTWTTLASPATLAPRSLPCHRTNVGRISFASVLPAVAPALYFSYNKQQTSFLTNETIYYYHSIIERVFRNKNTLSTSDDGDRDCVYEPFRWRFSQCYRDVFS